MYSICIKFKPELNWRAHCRQFNTEEECLRYINEAFGKWKVQHVSVFKDGQFLQCFWMRPALLMNLARLTDAMNCDKRRLYGNYSNR